MFAKGLPLREWKNWREGEERQYSAGLNGMYSISIGRVLPMFWGNFYCSAFTTGCHPSNETWFYVSGYPCSYRKENFTVTLVKLLWLIFLTAWYLKFDKDIISHSQDIQHSLRAGNVFKGFRRGPLKSVSLLYPYCIAHFWLQYHGRMKIHF